VLQQQEDVINLLALKTFNTPNIMINSNYFHLIGTKIYSKLISMFLLILVASIFSQRHKLGLYKRFNKFYFNSGKVKRFLGIKLIVLLFIVQPLSNYFLNLQFTMMNIFIALKEYPRYFERPFKDYSVTQQTLILAELLFIMLELFLIVGLNIKLHLLFKKAQTLYKRFNGKNEKEVEEELKKEPTSSSTLMMLYASQTFKVLIDSGRISWVLLLNLQFGFKTLILVCTQNYSEFSLFLCLGLDLITLISLFLIINFKRNKAIFFFTLMLMLSYLSLDISAILYNQAVKNE
jgi:hypothetical protein